jgi:hypothetical protein
VRFGGDPSPTSQATEAAPCGPSPWLPRTSALPFAAVAAYLDDDAVGDVNDDADQDCGHVVREEADDLGRGARSRPARPSACFAIDGCILKSATLNWRSSEREVGRPL